VKEDTTR